MNWSLVTDEDRALTIKILETATESLKGLRCPVEAVCQVAGISAEEAYTLLDTYWADYGPEAAQLISTSLDNGMGVEIADAFSAAIEHHRDMMRRCPQPAGQQ